MWLEIHERRFAGDRSDPLENENMLTAAALMEKDLRHAVGLAADLGLALPGAELAAGFGDEIYVVDPPIELP